MGHLNKKYKISFCTVCMNRLHHLKKTLTRNIEDNISYGNIEFIVLNYNSKDGLDSWIKTVMKKYIESGVLKYYRTREPKNFHMSHSKNVVAKQATGEIICNVDADNFLGLDFAFYINKMFNENENRYLAVDRKTGLRDCFGRICVLRSDFLRLKGYDESMKGYGFEDHDFWNRLEILGRKVRYIQEPEFLRALTHDDGERLKNEKNNKEIECIYFRHINHAISELLYLFHNDIFFIGKIIDNRLFNSESVDNLFLETGTFDHAYKLDRDKWCSGAWSANDDGVELKSKKLNILLKRKDNRTMEISLRSKAKVYHKVCADKEIEQMVMFFSQINNRIKLKKNKTQKLLTPNKNCFGETVFIETPQ